MEFLNDMVRISVAAVLVTVGANAAEVTAKTASAVFDFATERGAVKPLHGVNNAPVRVDGKRGQDEFKVAGIPYVRTHDTAGMWGGAHYVDIPNVFL